MFFVVKVAVYAQVPPPPPPGGSELWSGVTYRKANGNTNSKFPKTWGPNRLRKALSGERPLKGGYTGFSSILDGLKKGWIGQLTNEEWQILFDHAVGTGQSSEDISDVCSLSSGEGYIISDCINYVPLPRYLNLMLLITCLALVFQVYYKTTPKTEIN